MANEALEAVEEPVLDVSTYLARIGFQDTTEPSLACLTRWEWALRMVGSKLDV